MPKRQLDVSEWYPVYSLSDVGLEEHPQEFAEAEIIEYQRVMRDFKRWQTVLARRFGKKQLFDYTAISE